MKDLSVIHVWRRKLFNLSPYHICSFLLQSILLPLFSCLLPFLYVPVTENISVQLFEVFVCIFSVGTGFQGCLSVNAFTDKFTFSSYSEKDLVTLTFFVCFRILSGNLLKIFCSVLF